ncbi:MAG: sigma-70 family RNA polymerase sigma factor [Gemmatimonadota bacterium]|nr:sigma-70 family RNA polymerase sigma factor [Gemmatimonadota bacterium]
MSPTAISRHDTLQLHLLVLRCQAGDERAFAALLDRFGDATRGYLQGLVGDAADDVQQEVWLTVYQKLAQLTDPRAFRTWLYRTTRHRALDYLRGERRERELFVDDTDADVPDPGTDDTAGAALDTELLADAIAALGPLHREALLLRYRDGLSYAEIAVVVGCSLGTVRSRIHYARQHLRDAIAGPSDSRRTTGAATPTSFTRGQS